MSFLRITQLLRYGWIKHSRRLANRTGKNRLGIYLDIIYCYFKYDMWSNQYYRAEFCSLSKEERKEVGERIHEESRVRDAWLKELHKDKKLYAKYSDPKYDFGNRRRRRKQAYVKRFNPGKAFYVEHNVNICRQHFLDGSIQIGDHVKICKNTMLDYSGELIIGDDVSVSQGSLVFSHSHMGNLLRQLGRDTKAPAQPARTVLEKGAWIGANCVIFPGVTVGEYATVYAGTVVTQDVPAKAIVSGNPAKIISKPRTRRRRNRGENAQPAEKSTASEE